MKTTLGIYVAFVAVSLMLWSGCAAHPTRSNAKVPPSATVRTNR